MLKGHPRNYWFSLIVLALIFAACKKEINPGINPTPQPLAEKTILDTTYGTDGQQKMDIYLPAGRSTTSTKLIILIHGGAWNQGDKSDFATYIDTLKKRLPSYAIININYRLATGSANFFPTQENDVRAAIYTIYNRRAQYAISDKFVLLGASAGGHLALLQAYKNFSPVTIKAVVDFFGPTDLVDMYNNPANPLIPLILLQVTGGNPSTLPTLYHDSSPLNYVTAQSPPTIILQGGADIVVSPSQSANLNAKLQTFGVIHQYVYYPTENHGWTGPDLTDSFDKITAFINANVN
jgi:acetyl esterase/lipase